MTGRMLHHDWYPAPLPEHMTVGERSWIYSSFAFNHDRAASPDAITIGRETGVYNGTFFDLGPAGSVTVGDFTTLVGAIICSNRRVAIGSYVFIAHEVVLADEPAAIPACATAAGPGIVIEDNVWIGARAVILAGAHLGEGSIVGAACVVDFPVPPFSLVAGNPGRVVRSLRP